MFKDFDRNNLQRRHRRNINDMFDVISLSTESISDNDFSEEDISNNSDDQDGDDNWETEEEREMFG